MNESRSQYQTPRCTAVTSPEKKAKKRLRDWAAEDAAQVGRGRIDLYITPDLFERPEKTGRRGAPADYSQALIWGALVLRQLEHKAYRPLEGFICALARLCGYEGETPDHVTLWRRGKATPLPPLPSCKGKRVVVVDSTGVKVFGPGEWRRHRDAGRIQRKYLKFHAVRDAHSGEILDWALTGHDGYGTGDGLVGSWMLQSLVSEGMEIDKACGDGAYDQKRWRQAVWRGGGQALAPPPRNAALSRGYERGETGDWQAERDQQIIECSTEERRAAWKEASGYHVRSLAETTFSRHHAMFGERLMSRLPEQQSLEMGLRVWLMNEHAQRSVA